jgi:hypothetical protein
MVESRVASLLKRINGLGTIGLVRVSITDVRRWRSGGAVPAWADGPGVYIFERAGRVEYVGRALRATLRQRLAIQVSSLGDPLWNVVLDDDATTIAVLPLPSEEWYWAAAIEAALIVDLRPARSKRI